MAKQFAAIIFLLASSVHGRDCERACKTFEDNNQKYLVHEAKVACKKHNISPRPTTEDICLSTFRALTRSTCLNFCDRSPLVPEACGAIAGTTWIPKHNAYKACKTGYREATRKIPGLIEQAAENTPLLSELFGLGVGVDHHGFKVHKASTIRFDKPAREEFAQEEHGNVDPSSVGQGEEEVFEFPITIDDGSVQMLVVSSKDDIAAKVNEFCAQYMAGEADCSEQLLPIVVDRMQTE
jgi:hypothetical protein